MNAEVIFVKTDVMRWLFSCRDVENDEICEECIFEGMFRILNMESSRIKGKTKTRWLTLMLSFLL